MTSLLHLRSYDCKKTPFLATQTFVRFHLKLSAVLKRLASVAPVGSESQPRKPATKSPGALEYSAEAKQAPSLI